MIACSRRMLVGLATAGAAFVGVATVGSGVARTETRSTRTGEWPNAILALGHSVVAGYDSDPAHPEVDARRNSWVTGDNPDVNSIYRRILAHNPAIAGHAVNLADDGADMGDVGGQARRATQGAAGYPDLIVIQVLDNDILCDGNDPANYARFGHTFRVTLRTLTNAYPEARIFVISQIGKAGTLADALGSTSASRAQFSGDGLCDFFSPSGGRVEAHVRNLDEITSAYEKRLRRNCALFVHCRYGDMHSYVDHLEDLSHDLNHFAVGGQARLAALAWSQMFDFTDATPPVSRAEIHRRHGVTRVEVRASDRAGVSGIEYAITHRGEAPHSRVHVRYVHPLLVRNGFSLAWRAVDVNGNAERWHALVG